MIKREGIVEKIDRAISRRAALSKFTQVVSSLVLGIFAIPPKIAHACVGCCNLCHPSTEYNPSDCDCQWGWICVDKTNCFDWACWECIKPLDLGGCTASWCSKFNVKSGNPCFKCTTGQIASKAVILGKIPGCIPK